MTIRDRLGKKIVRLTYRGDPIYRNTVQIRRTLYTTYNGRFFLFHGRPQGATLLYNDVIEHARSAREYSRVAPCGRPCVPSNTIAPYLNSIAIYGVRHTSEAMCSPRYISSRPIIHER